jgi:hypothetical protein
MEVVGLVLAQFGAGVDEDPREVDVVVLLQELSCEQGQVLKPFFDCSVMSRDWVFKFYDYF